MAIAHWQWIHTILAVLLATVLATSFTNTFIFYEDYQKAFGLSSFQYSIITSVSCYLGVIASIFIGIFINNIFSEKYPLITATCSLMCGILSLLFGLVTYMPYSPYLTIIYGSIITFSYKNFQSICYSTIITLANKYSKDTEKGKNVSYIQASWALATLLYIPTGYAIQYIGWYTSFVVFGVISIIYYFIIIYIFKFEDETSLSTASIYQSIAQRFSDLKSVFNTKILLVLSSVFFCTLASGSFLVVTSSLWMEDVYNLNASQVGWFTLTEFAAEMTGSIIMGQISDKYGIYICSFIAFAIKIVDMFIILMLSIFIGPNIGHISIAIISTFFLFVGWEIFFISSIISVIQLAPQNVSKNVVIMSQFAVASIGKMSGIEISSFLWYNGNGLKYLILIWLISNIFGLLCYIVLYRMKRIGLYYTKISTMSTDNETDNELTYEQQLKDKLLVFGYIRKQEHENKDIHVPSKLKKLIFQYFWINNNIA
eukprot:7077_1